MVPEPSGLFWRIYLKHYTGSSKNDLCTLYTSRICSLESHNSIKVLKIDYRTYYKRIRTAHNIYLKIHINFMWKEGKIAKFAKKIFNTCRLKMWFILFIFICRWFFQIKISKYLRNICITRPVDVWISVML